MGGCICIENKLIANNIKIKNEFSTHKIRYSHKTEKLDTINEKETDYDKYKNKQTLITNNTLEKKGKNKEKKENKEKTILIKPLKKSSSSLNLKLNQSLILKGKNVINIVLIGEKQTGKSCFLIKLIENRFENLYIPTVYIETISKVMTYNNKRYVLNFDVTPGEQEYQQDYSSLYGKSHFIFLFYDVTNLGSFNRAKKFVKKELKNQVIMYSHKFSNIFIIGNKIDSSPFIESSSQIKSYCEKHKLEFFEISVKTNAGIGYMMNKLLAIFDNISSL